MNFVRPYNQHVLDLIAIQCRSISWPEDKSLKEDLEHMTAEVKEVVDPQIVDIILEMVGKYRESLKLERYADRKAPWVLAYNAYQGTWATSQEDKRSAEEIRDAKLTPLVGQDRANYIWLVTNHRCWAEQNSEDYENAGGGRFTGSRWGYRDDSFKDKYWGDYYADFMGFSEVPTVAPNVTIKLLCYHRARLWTAQNCTSTRTLPDYGPQSRRGAFEIAEKRSKALLPHRLVDLIVEICVAWREATYWNRQNSSSPLQMVAELVDSITGNEETPEVLCKTNEDKAAEIRGRLRLMPGMTEVCDNGADNAQVIFELCFNCAWHEQNKVDYDTALTVDHTTGHSQGYQKDAADCLHKVALCSYRLKLGASLVSDS